MLDSIYEKLLLYPSKNVTLLVNASPPFQKPQLHSNAISNSTLTFMPSKFRKVPPPLIQTSRFTPATPNSTLLPLILLPPLPPPQLLSGLLSQLPLASRTAERLRVGPLEWREVALCQIGGLGEEAAGEPLVVVAAWEVVGLHIAAHLSQSVE